MKLLVVAALAGIALGIPRMNRISSAERPPLAEPANAARRVVRPLTEERGPARAAQAHEYDGLLRERPLPTYHGTVVRIHSEAKGADLTTQQQIVDLLAKLDTAPAGRVAHFAWQLDGHGVTHTGWNGTITHYERRPVGYLVTISFCPRLHSPGHAYSPDYILETYLFSRGQLALVRVVHPADAKRIIAFN